MSRTDGHAPYWTYAIWWEPCHYLWCEKDNFARYRSRQVACNLPDRPVRHAGGRTRRTVGLCTWGPVWPSYRQMHKLYGSRVPRWYIEHVWHNPERVRTRDKLGELAREYNATGDLEDGDFPNWQGRNGASWNWE